MAARMDGQKLAAIFRQAAEDHQQQRYRAAAAGYAKILKWQPDHFDVLHLMGQTLIQDGQAAKALRYLKQAVKINPESADGYYDLGLAYRKTGRHEQAAHAYRRALDIEPDRLNAHLSLVEMKFPGEHYTVILRELHQRLRPANYLEIGVETGQSMSLANADTQCIGVDPEPCIRKTLPPRCEVYAQTSDAFFEQYDVRGLFDGQAVAFAFIDGLHVFEAALRDFIHIEQNADRNTVVAIHDCIPLDDITSSRQRRTNFWSGDIWKLILCLKQYRPELHIANVATKPTGLGLVTGLDPSSRVLSTHYDAIVQQLVPMNYTEIAAQERAALNVIDNDMAVITQWLLENRPDIKQTA